MKKIVSILVLVATSVYCHAFSAIERIHETDTSKCEEDSTFNDWTEEEYLAYEDSVIAALYSPVIFIESDSTDLPMQISSLYFSNDNGVSNSNVPTNISVNTNNIVGEIPIISKESETGAKIYEIPLELSAGMNNFKPELSLYYNSQMGNTTLGKGWAVKGLSEITRANKSLYYDGIVQSIELQGEDAFTLDGMRLIKLSTSGNMSLYDTETGNIKVRAYVNSGIVNYFEVFYPNGNKGVYGFENNAENQMFYPLTSLSDLNGNTIAYSYEYESNHYRISAISYNGSSVNFVYQQRNNPVTSYSAGLKIEETKLLKEIVCNYDNQTLRTYILSYSSQNNGENYSLLQSVGCIFGNENVNPITFYYGTGNTLSSYTSLSRHLSSGYTSSDQNRIATRLGKVNPYYDSDVLIAFPNENPYWQHYRNSTVFRHSQNRFDNMFSGTERIIISGELNTDYSLQGGTVYTEAGFVDLLCTDLEGTQEESLVKINNVALHDSDRVKFNVYKPNVISGLSLSYTRTYDFSTVYTDADGNKSIQPKYYFSGDFDGNGKMEILAVSAHNPFGDTSKPSKCYIFDLTNNSVLFQDHVFAYNVNFVGTRQTDPVVANNNTDKLMVLDFDGDGKTDICHINDSGIFVYTFVADDSNWQCQLVASSSTINKSQLANRDVLLGEINGDGLMDIVVTSSTTGGYDWKILKSKGDGTFDVVTSYYKQNSNDIAYLLQDVNGDGITDLLRCTSSGFDTFLTRNNAFDITSIYTQFEETTSQLIPVNINSHNNFTKIVSLKDCNVVNYSFSKDVQKETLITGMINSLGVIERNEYHYTNHEGEEYGVYSQGSESDFPYINLNERIPVIAISETLLNGTQIKKDKYRYTKAVYHCQGLGFCGFSSIAKMDIRNHTTYKTYNPYQFGTLVSEENLMYRKEYVYDTTVASNKTRKQNVSDIYYTNYLTGVESESQYQYNSFGFPISETTSYTGNISVTTQKQYSDNSTIGNGYVLGLISNIEVSTVSGNDSYIKRTYIPEYSNGHPVSKQSFVNGNIVLQQDYTYDTYGNVLTESTRKYNSDYTTTIRNIYDNRGHVISKTDAYGNIESFTYGTNGQKRTYTDKYGNVQTFSYDDLGRVVYVVDDENVYHSFAYEWNSQGTNGIFSVCKSGNTIPTSTTVYDALNREVRISDIRFDGTERKTDKQYDIYGISLPNLCLIPQMLRIGKLLRTTNTIVYGEL